MRRPKLEPTERPSMRQNEVTIPTDSLSSVPRPRSAPRIMHMQPR